MKSGTETAAREATTGERVRYIVGLILVFGGPALVVGELFRSIVVGPIFSFPANPAVLALGYAVTLAGWLVLPGRIGTRLASAGIAVAALLIGANSVPSAKFTGLESTIRLDGLAGSFLGAGPIGAVALAVAVTLTLFAWLRVRNRTGLALLALLPPFLVQLVFGLIIAAWSQGPFAAARWPVMLATVFLPYPLHLPLVLAGLGAIIGWAILLGGSAWLAVAIERAANAARRMRSERPQAVVRATTGGAVAAITPTNTFAILSLVFAFVVSVLGVVFGHIARNQIRRTGEDGYGLATAGMVIGYVQIGFTALLWIAYAVIIGAAQNGFH